MIASAPVSPACASPVRRAPGRRVARSRRRLGQAASMAGAMASAVAEIVDRRARIGGKRFTEEESAASMPSWISAPTIGPRARSWAGDGEDAQMAGEIAAVDGREVAGLQRLERARVVPVVEVSAVALEIRYRRQGRSEPVDRVERADEAEVSRGHRREQVDAHVGRRSPVGDDGPWVLLEVVRRQRVVLGGHEGLEEAPAPAHGRQEELPLVGARGARAVAWPPGG